MRFSVTRGNVAAAVATVVVCAAFGSIPYLYSSSHPLLPGLRGCQTVRSLTPRLKCMDRAYRSLISSQGSRKAFAAIDSLGTNARILGDCHQAFHLTGRWYARHGVNQRLIDSFDYAKGVCSLGFVHGVTEQLVATNPKNFGVMAERVCERADIRDGWESCYHGIGHGLVKNQQSDPRTRCLDLPAGSPTVRCINGVYMQQSFTAKPNHPFSLCDGIPDEDRFQCGLYVSGLMWKESVTKPADIYHACSKQPDRVLRWGCAAGATYYSSQLTGMSLCTSVRDTVEANLCVNQLVRGPANNVPIQQVATACNDAGVALYGCGAGLGTNQRVAVSHKASDTQLVALCRTVHQPSVRSACEAGALDCYPKFSIEAQPRACRGRVVPAAARLWDDKGTAFAPQLY